MSFEIKNQSGELKTIIQVLKDIIPEANIHFTEKGLNIATLDQTHTVYIECNIHKDYFDIYNSKKDKVGIDLIKFNKLLDTIDADERLIVTAKNSQIEIIGKSKSVTKKHILPIINIHQDNLTPIDKKNGNTPKKFWSITVIIGSNKYTKLINYLKKISDFVEIECTKKSLKFSAGDNYDSIQTFDWEVSEDLKILYRDSVKANRYEITSLSLTKKMAPLCEKVRIYMGDMMKIQYNFDHGHFSVYIAPQTNDSDFEDEMYDSDDSDIDII